MTGRMAIATSDTITHLSFDEVCALFKGVKRTGEGKAMAFSPCRDEKMPSVSLSTGKGGRILIYDHGGGKTEDICAALGIDIRQLMPPSNGKPECRHIAKIYRYVDADGVLQFEKIRYIPKSFVIRRPDPEHKGGHVYNLNGCARPLYRLPELLAAIERDDAVGVCEGEKDADNVLRETGIVCTCNFDGAGKWRAEYSDVLRKASLVYLFGDNDPPGRAHVRKIAAQLPNARVVEFPDLFEHGDVSDYLETHTAAELLELCEAAPADLPGDATDATAEAAPARGLPEPWDVSSRMLDEDAPPLRFAFDGLVPRGAIAGFVGQGGVGKGWATCIIILSACIGRGLLPVFAPVGWQRVLWAQSEDTEDELWRRMRKTVRGYSLTPDEIERVRGNLRIIGGKAFPLVAREGGIVAPTVYYRELATEVADFNPDILVLDPLAHFVAVDENSNPDMSVTLSLLKELLPPDAVLWINHHTSKAMETTPTSAAARGASAIRDSVRAAFSLVPVSAETVKQCAIQNPELFIEMHHTKANWNPKLADGVVFQREVDTLGGLLRQVDVTAIKQEVAQSEIDRLVRAIADTLGDNPERISKRDICFSKAGKAVRDSIKDAAGIEATTRQIQAAFEHAETLEYVIVKTEAGSTARIPRKNNEACPF